MTNRSQQTLLDELVSGQTEWTNDFNKVETENSITQWKHKISVIPESEGITTRWWELTAGVSRVGPEAQIPPGDTLRTKQSGEYIVGKPALAGGAIRVEGTAQSGASDDFWGGYTDRVNETEANDNGAGIGLAYFDEGEGDEGGAETAGEQEYVWFKSGVSGVSDKRVPRDQWNGDSIDVIAEEENGDIIRKGGFVRVDFTFYNQGSVKVKWGFKRDNGTIEVKTLHAFNVSNDPMWSQSDLHMEFGTEGTNLTGYTNAAHFESGSAARTIRENGTGRDGAVLGSGVTVAQGDPRPLISIQLRDSWENVNIQPVALNAEFDDSFYLFISVGSDLVGATFEDPNSEISGITPTGSEYAANTDNDATDFNSIGDIEYFTYVASSSTGNTTSSLGDSIPDFSLSNGEIATLGVIPVDATSFIGASFRWGANF